MSSSECSDAVVAFAEAVEVSIDGLHEPAGILAGAEKCRAHHGRERQRDDSGHGHRAGQGECELGEQGAGEAALKADRHVHCDQHHRHGNDRAAELARCNQRGIERPAMLRLHMPVNILDHDDGVIDHQADGQHQRQQRQEIDRVSQRQHHEEGADQRQRHGNDGDDDGAQASQEEEDDEGHDDERFRQRFHDLDDGGVDELGGVVDDFTDDPGWQLRLDFGERFADALRDRQDIGLRRHLDAKEYRPLAAERDVQIVVLGAECDLGDIFEPHDRVAHLLDRQLPKLLDRMQIGSGGHVDGDHLALAGAHRRQVVVVAERREHVLRRDVVCRELRGVQPGAQCELTRTDNFSRLHAGQRVELRLDHADQIVGDAVGRDGVAVETHVHGVDRLADLHRQYRLLGLWRQLVLDRVDLSADFGESAIRVIVQPQGCGDGRHPGGARGGNVIDALGLRDRRFERLRDEARHGRGVRPVVDRGDGDDGVFGVRILIDRQAADRPQSQHQDQQADDDCEYRTADEEIGEFHGRCLTVLEAPGFAR